MNPQWDIEQLPIVDSEGEKLSALRIGCRFPMLPEQRAILLEMLQGIHRWLDRRSAQRSHREVIIQMNQLPRPGGADILSRNSSSWKPGLAIGVWPDREPPRSLTKQDFTHRLPGQKLPTTADEARRILSKSRDVLQEVEDQMAGSGALLEIVAGESWPQIDGRQISAWLKNRIVDEVYRAYSFYVPMLDSRTLVHLSKADREICLAGIDLYLREDLEDECIFLIARMPFEEALEMLNMSLTTSTTR